MAKLTVVPTPVGNLEDMTFRAIRVLKEADLILAEDTRTTGILLKHFEIQNRMQSHHKFNEHGTTAAVVERLKAGEAAQIDGASRLQRILHINLPGILPTAIIMFILDVGQVMNMGFEKVFLMQNVDR